MKTKVLLSLVLFISALTAYAEDNVNQLLKGAWLDQSCHQSSADLALSAQTSLKFEGNQVLVVNRYFESNDCSGEVTFTVDYQGTLEIGKATVKSNGETVTQYSIIIPAVVIESAHLEAGITLSRVDSCDTQSWSFGDSRDVFSCVFAQKRSNVIQRMAMVEGNTLLQGKIITKA